MISQNPIKGWSGPSQGLYKAGVSHHKAGAAHHKKLARHKAISLYVVARVLRRFLCLCIVTFWRAQMARMTFLLKPLRDHWHSIKGNCFRASLLHHASNRDRPSDKIRQRLEFVRV